ncbi:hypothetical protein HDU85_001121 [Gaertneriomyces sp. JEL0708]|nr:hypothetical protein HDU85_001121 [Gaertneriomyces sp. JEL0708]
MPPYAAQRRRKKIVCVGDYGVGKTAALLVYCGATFPVDHFPTVTDTYTSTSDLEDDIELCDTSGDEALDRLRPFSYDEVDIFLICFSLDNRKSLENVEEKWVPEVRYFGADVPLILVGCKQDLRTSEAQAAAFQKEGISMVSYQMGEDVATRIGAYKYVECSAKTGQGISDMFEFTRRSLEEEDRKKTLTRLKQDVTRLKIPDSFRPMRGKKSFSSIATSTTSPMDADEWSPMDVTLPLADGCEQDGDNMTDGALPDQMGLDRAAQSSKKPLMDQPNCKPASRRGSVGAISMASSSIVSTFTTLLPVPADPIDLPTAPETCPLSAPSDTGAEVETPSPPSPVPVPSSVECPVTPPSKTDSTVPAHEPFGKDSLKASQFSETRQPRGTEAGKKRTKRKNHAACCVIA